jgi:mycothiol synthase
MSSAEPAAPTIRGLRIRPYAGEADMPDIVRIENAENAADQVDYRMTVSDLRARYRNPSEQFDPARDVVIAVVDGTVVGFANQDWIDTHDVRIREHRLGGAVDPQWRRRGVGSALLADNERRARALAATHDTDRPRAFGAFSGEHQPGAIALLTGAGYTQVRYFFDMERPNLDEVPDVPLPEGLELRPITPDLLRRMWDADVEAFRDHWGGFDASDAAFQRYLDAPDNDPTLWVVAFDGDEIAGAVVNTIYAAENAALGVRRGWLDSVFTRRPWRRRGLARALIARSLVVLRERGMTSAMLGVDAENPSGALSLYESVGFGVVKRFTAWRKPMGDGVSEGR